MLNNIIAEGVWKHLVNISSEQLYYQSFSFWVLFSFGDHGFQLKKT